MSSPKECALWPHGYAPFTPRSFVANGHLQTILGNLLPRPDHLPPAEEQFVEMTPAHGSQISSQVRCECHWQPETTRAASPTVIVVHGLEGSSRSQYVIGNANKLWNAGCNVVRMNMRNCGGTERLTPTLYHSGMSSDVLQVMEFFLCKYQLTSFSLIGYSMGGNLVLKLAGDLGAQYPQQLRSVIGVSPAMDLAMSADALHEWQNRFYERRFLRALLKRFGRKALLFPRAFDSRVAGNIHSLRQFDDKVTALYSGFLSADDYYYRAAAARVLEKIAVPTLIIHACDDPFIRIAAETRQKIYSNPHITFLETPHGGHCAFLAKPEPSNGNDGYWAEHTALRFLLMQAELAV